MSLKSVVYFTFMAHLGLDQPHLRFLWPHVGSGHHIDYEGLEL